ncbi:serine hydrolase domain-containing protein [Emticicia agri]|uniref:Class C beta-lactamase-related serine hydrolase n=1 Tax=Emticicia agri TaxID=2492393 RepID=A0A4Q5M675_9BACT|nr:serine hydrolase [Emticicia agri]RYU97467.1 class C beta-lactamase-related serine hydrolase [Emticicia agri]
MRNLLPIFFAITIAFTAFSQNKSIFPDTAMREIEKGKYPNIDGIVISQHNKIIYQHYFNGLTENSVHDVRSAFKSITSLLMGIAIDKGYIKNVNEKVYSFFPQYRSFKNLEHNKLDMTIKDLLEMKGGFDCEEWNSTKDCEDEMEQSKDWLKFSLDLPMAHKPGTHWDYNSSAPMVIGGIIESATKMPLATFAATFLFKPLGITNYRWTKDPVGHFMTAGSFYMKPIDMEKIGQLVLKKGMWYNKPIISKKWIEESTKPITKIEDFSNVQISKTKNVSPQPTYYGYYWYNEKMVTEQFSYHVVFSSGNGGQYFMIIPDLDLVVAFTGNSFGSWKSKLPFEILIKNILPFVKKR